MLTSSIPLILQSELAECGLACLAMIFHYYKAEIDLSSLRSTQHISLKGMTLANLITIAKKFSFETSALKIEPSKLLTLKLPCILHWDMNHFVVLVKLRKKRVLIYDPAVGKRIITFETFHQHFTGIALEIKPSKNFQPFKMKKKLTALNLIENFNGMKKIMLFILVFSLVLQGFIIISPQYIQHIVDSLQNVNKTQHLIFLALLFCGLKILEMGFFSIRNYSINYFGSRINLKIGEKIFNHLLKLPMSYYEKRQSADIIARFNSIDKIRAVIIEGSVEGIIDGLMSLTTFIVMLTYDWIMASIVLCSVGLYWIIRQIRFRNFRMCNDKMIQFNTVQNTFFIETIRGMLPIKIFLNEKQRQSSWKDYYVKFLNSTHETLNQQIVFNACKNLSFHCEMILVILIGAIGILHHHFTLGMLYAFIFYRTQFVNSAGSFIDHLLEYKMLSLHLDRLSDIILESPEKTDSDKKIIIHDIQKIEVKNLSYQYGDFEDFVLNNISFSVNTQESIVITAPSGYGKTTLLKLLMGLLIPTKGEIFINDIPLSKIDINSYRKLIASVMQEDTLFAGNIYENIAFFASSINHNKIIDCAKVAGIHDEIMKLPMNYQTFIGDMGTVLSGGQKQRVLLARALYHDPKVIFLDESTSHLDAQKEKEINEALKKINITKIIIAHRLETIKSADKILDLTK